MPSMREYDITDVPVMNPEVQVSIEKRIKIEKKEARIVAPSDAHRKSKKKTYARKISRQQALIRTEGHNKDKGQKK